MLSGAEETFSRLIDRAVCGRKLPALTFYFQNGTFKPSHALTDINSNGHFVAILLHPVGDPSKCFTTASIMHRATEYAKYSSKWASDRFQFVICCWIVGGGARIRPSRFCHFITSVRKSFPLHPLDWLFHFNSSFCYTSDQTFQSHLTYNWLIF